MSLTPAPVHIKNTSLTFCFRSLQYKESFYFCQKSKIFQVIVEKIVNFNKLFIAISKEIQKLWKTSEILHFLTKYL